MIDQSQRLGIKVYNLRLVSCVLLCCVCLLSYKSLLYSTVLCLQCKIVCIICYYWWDEGQRKTSSCFFSFKNCIAKVHSIGKILRKKKNCARLSRFFNWNKSCKLFSCWLFALLAWGLESKVDTLVTFFYVGVSYKKFQSPKRLDKIFDKINISASKIKNIIKKRSNRTEAFDDTSWYIQRYDSLSNNREDSRLVSHSC